MTASLRTRRGPPLPLGATRRPGGVNFAVFTRHATALRHGVYRTGSFDVRAEIPLDPRYNRTGDIWHAFVERLGAGAEYGYRADGPSGGPIHRFDPSTILVDPFGKAPAGAEAWGHDAGPVPRGVRSRRTIVIDDDFDWGHDPGRSTAGRPRISQSEIVTRSTGPRIRTGRCAGNWWKMPRGGTRWGN